MWRIVRSAIRTSEKQMHPVLPGKDAKIVGLIGKVWEAWEATEIMVAGSVI